MTYNLNSLFTWRINTNAVKPDNDSISTEVYIVTKDDTSLSVTDITIDCTIVANVLIDSTSGLHQLYVQYTPLDDEGNLADPKIYEFIVVCRETGSVLKHFILRGRPNGEKKYITGSKFVTLFS